MHPGALPHMNQMTPMHHIDSIPFDAHMQRNTIEAQQYQMQMLYEFHQQFGTNLKQRKPKNQPERAEFIDGSHSMHQMAFAQQGMPAMSPPGFPNPAMQHLPQQRFPFGSELSQQHQARMMNMHGVRPGNMPPGMMPAQMPNPFQNPRLPHLGNNSRMCMPGIFNEENAMYMQGPISPSFPRMRHPTARSKQKRTRSADHVIVKTTCSPIQHVLRESDTRSMSASNLLSVAAKAQLANQRQHEAMSRMPHLASQLLQLPSEELAKLLQAQQNRHLPGASNSTHTGKPPNTGSGELLKEQISTKDTDTLKEEPTSSSNKQLGDQEQSSTSEQGKESMESGPVIHDNKSSSEEPSVDNNAGALSDERNTAKVDINVENAEQNKEAVVPVNPQSSDLEAKSPIQCLKSAVNNIESLSQTTPKKPPEANAQSPSPKNIVNPLLPKKDTESDSPKEQQTAPKPDSAEGATSEEIQKKLQMEQEYYLAMIRNPQSVAGNVQQPQQGNPHFDMMYGMPRMPIPPGQMVPQMPHIEEFLPVGYPQAPWGGLQNPAFAMQEIEMDIAAGGPSKKRRRKGKNQRSVSADSLAAQGNIFPQHMPQMVPFTNPQQPALEQMLLRNPHMNPHLNNPVHVNQMHGYGVAPNMIEMVQPPFPEQHPQPNMPIPPIEQQNVNSLPVIVQSALEEAPMRNVLPPLQQQRQYVKSSGPKKVKDMLADLRNSNQSSSVGPDMSTRDGAASVQNKDESQVVSVSITSALPGELKHPPTTTVSSIKEALSSQLFSPGSSLMPTSSGEIHEGITVPFVVHTDSVPESITCTSAAACTTKESKDMCLLQSDVSFKENSSQENEGNQAECIHKSDERTFPLEETSLISDKAADFDSAPAIQKVSNCSQNTTPGVESHTSGREDEAKNVILEIIEEVSRSDLQDSNSAQVCNSSSLKLSGNVGMTSTDEQEAATTLLSMTDQCVESFVVDRTEPSEFTVQEHEQRVTPELENVEAVEMRTACSEMESSEEVVKMSDDSENHKESVEPESSETITKTSESVESCVDSVAIEQRESSPIDTKTTCKEELTELHCALSIERPESSSVLCSDTAVADTQSTTAYDSVIVSDGESGIAHEKTARSVESFVPSNSVASEGAPDKEISVSEVSGENNTSIKEDSSEKDTKEASSAVNTEQECNVPDETDCDNTVQSTSQIFPANNEQECEIGKEQECEIENKQEYETGGRLECNAGVDQERECEESVPHQPVPSEECLLSSDELDVDSSHQSNSAATIGDTNTTESQLTTETSEAGETSLCRKVEENVCSDYSNDKTESKCVEENSVERTSVDSSETDLSRKEGCEEDCPEECNTKEKCNVLEHSPCGSTRELCVGRNEEATGENSPQECDVLSSVVTECNANSNNSNHIYQSSHNQLTCMENTENVFRTDGIIQSIKLENLDKDSINNNNTSTEVTDDFVSSPGAPAVLISCENSLQSSLSNSSANSDDAHPQQHDSVDNASSNNHETSENQQSIEQCRTIINENHQPDGEQVQAKSIDQNDAVENNDNQMEELGNNMNQSGALEENDIQSDALENNSNQSDIEVRTSPKVIDRSGDDSPSPEDSSNKEEPTMEHESKIIPVKRLEKEVIIDEKKETKDDSVKDGPSRMALKDSSVNNIQEVVSLTEMAKKPADHCNAASPVLDKPTDNGVMGKWQNIIPSG